MKKMLKRLTCLMRMCVSSQCAGRCYIITICVHGRLVPMNINTAMLSQRLECMYSWIKAVHVYQCNKNVCGLTAPSVQSRGVTQ